MGDWLDRDGALAALGVRAQTLYAYVSRGTIERRADAADPRRSLYRASDVATLAARAGRGRRPADIAASAIAWGEPIIATALSTVDRGRLIYRGQDATVLARHATLEEVAALLWDVAPVPSLVGASTRDPWVALATLASEGRATIGRPAAKLAQDAAIAAGAIAGGFGAAGQGPVHRRLAMAWGVKDADPLRRALTLLADHELNPSTFAVRVAASTGASIAACLLAGLAALSGPRHGGAGKALAALAAEAARDGAGAAVARWLASGWPLPGFGHPLYPAGDPRAAAMLADSAPDDALATLAAAALEATGAVPNIDFALLALTRRLALPADAPFRLFAIARAIGWSAHAIEQAVSGQGIRPRATYTGVPPQAATSSASSP